MNPGAGSTTDYPGDVLAALASGLAADAIESGRKALDVVRADLADGHGAVLRMRLKFFGDDRVHRQDDRTTAFGCHVDHLERGLGRQWLSVVGPEHSRDGGANRGANGIRGSRFVVHL